MFVPLKLWVEGSSTDEAREINLLLLELFSEEGGLTIKLLVGFWERGVGSLGSSGSGELSLLLGVL